MRRVARASHLPMMIRPASPDDYNRLGRVMFHAVRNGTSPYTDAQRVAWMPKVNAGPDWAARLARHHIVVAEWDETIVGFMSVDAQGYIDLAFILPQARGQGVFTLLLDAVTKQATGNGLSELRTHASLMAQLAFARHGFKTVHHEIVERAGQNLQRAEMCKSI